MRIGAYEVLAEVGRGGAGAVYRARSPRGEEVAVKVLLHDSAENRARFDRERRTLASLGDAEGFVPLLDAGVMPDGAPFVVMPFLPGGTLRDRLARGALEVGTTVELGRALARAMTHAHARGIVHRDLKPENVLFTADGKARVADLGLAKHFRRAEATSASLSQTGVFRGTLCYAAPEQLTDSKTVGPAADVHALGAILHECLTGVPLFDALSITEAMAKVMRSERPSVQKLRPEVPAWLDAAIARALTPEVGLRFADAAELSRAFEAGKEKAPSRRSRLPLVAGLLVLAAGGVAAAVSLSGRETPPVPPTGPKLDRSEEAKAMERATAAVAAKDYKTAHRELSRIIELDPGYATAWANRGHVREKMGDRLGAIADTDRAIALEPTNGRHYTNRGIVKQRLDDTAGAIADYTKAIELDPRIGQAWANRALLRSHDDLAGAESDAERAIELDPTESNGWYTRGIARSRRGENEGAESDFTRCIELDPGRSSAWFNRGCARMANDPARAIDDFSRAIELEPSQFQAFANRGVCRLQRAAPGDMELALQDLDEAVRLRPEDPLPRIARARAHAALGDRVLAISELEAILRDGRLPPHLVENARTALEEIKARAR